MKTEAQRDSLIETGLRLLHERGFTATGVRDIAAAAQVPQGSFTNHFRSKEAFGAIVLDRYCARLDAVMDATLRDAGKPAPERLRAYFDAIEGYLEAANWRTGCLIPDLASEIPVHSDVLRQRLCVVLQRQTAAFRLALQDMLAGCAPDETADLATFIVAAWHGTLLRMKAEQNPDAIRSFRRILEVQLKNGG